MPVHKNSKISRHLKNLYLDPNNYRFIDNNNYVFISENDSINEKIQQRTRSFIEGKHREGIKDLLDSFKANGFLEVDRIQLKDLGENKYLVLEGNRRITALKVLFEDYQKGLDIGNFDTNIFTSIPSVIHQNENEAKHRIIMGLKHISGNKKWPAINQAKLIYDYLQPHWNKEIYSHEEITLSESLGITKVKLRSSQRAYHFVLQYKQSDYGDQFESDMYYTFAEITKKPSIKQWINWDDKDYKAEHTENTLRLFSWLSEREETEDLNDDEIDDAKKYPPIITKYREVQDLAKFIDDAKALDVMEETGSVAQGLLASGNIEQASYEKSLKALRDNISELDRLKDLMSDEDKLILKSLNKNFINILPEDSSLDIQIKNVSVYFEKGKISHFDSLSIKKYKIFKEFKIEKLNRINIFSGFNNSGKTTLLEAIYLLTKQNNIGAFFELTRLKNKLDKLNTRYLNNYLNENINISGCFNQVNTQVMIKKFEASTDFDKKDDYIASYEVIALTDNEELKTITHTFEQNPLQRFSDKVEVLCHSIFKSPYFYNRNEIINTHSKNVELKTFSLIVEFAQEYIDANIKNIGFTETDDIKRFLVDSKMFPEYSVDISTYGEGLQRIFEIALSFAYCKNGVLLIDELETAIHHSLLVKFTKFIQELAGTFNVQVFITSHSKECIDAFVNNDFNNDDISAYFLEDEGVNIEAIQINGTDLKEYIESTNFDLRGNKNG